MKTIIQVNDDGKITGMAGSGKAREFQRKKSAPARFVEWDEFVGRLQ